MTIILAALMLMSVLSVRLRTREEGNNYMSKEDTQPLKGVFVFIVFMSHFFQYLPSGTAHSAAYIMFRRFMGQLVVVPFIFLSGYGVRLSYIRKGKSYLDTYVKNRIIRTWFFFCCAVCLCIFANACQGKIYPLKRTLLAFTGWESIGNSNWYMLCLVYMYIACFIAFSVAERVKTCVWVPYLIISF